ncbi:MAG TPA: hypothetical protein EYN67_08240 [Flavobacteriales bacterium]|nr:hypothetical protein [Flavobacteriales bacterium]
MPKGKISRRQHCGEYKQLFACAKKTGKIIPNLHYAYLVSIVDIHILPPGGSLPSYLRYSDFEGLKVRIGKMRKIQPILKPHAYCYKKSSSVPTPPSFIHTGSLDNLRQHSGCAPRRSGSSSRFAPSPGKCYQPHCFKAPCPEICYDDQGNVIDNSSARREMKDFGTQVTDFLKGPKGIITIVALVVFFVLTKKI